MSTETASPSKRSAIFLQDACYQHQYIRSRDVSAIVERPERLRAVTVGLSAAIARLETAFHGTTSANMNVPLPPASEAEEEPLDPDDLAAVMGRMKIIPDSRPSPVSIVRSQASVDLLNDPAVKYIHGDVDGDVYLEDLKGWARDSWDKIRNGGSEIPEGLAQGDLYLCPESMDAIQGAVGTVCEAVDRVVASSRDTGGPSSAASATLPTQDPAVHRAFVAIRPPGHHCGEDTPSGFCFVNNVAIGAAHAHLKHGVNRVVILDIDLHHGNGTQSIVWQINEETYRQKLESDAGAPSPERPGLQVYYGSIHDILSYPCEDGKAGLIQAASVSLHKSHGQYIENVHLQEYTSEEHFWNTLYTQEYSKVLRKAEEFLDGTGGPGDDVMVFISCGMDACEHEYESMSRHNRKVPTGFYHRFARDVCALSDRYAQGRVVSVLEGGYSDRALISGAMAHLSGLVDMDAVVEEEWWSVENLSKIEKATKKRRGGRASVGTPGTTEPWLERTLELFNSLNSPGQAKQGTPASSRTLVPPSSMTLRQRKTRSAGASTSPTPSASPSPSPANASGLQRTGSDVQPKAPRSGGRGNVKAELMTPSSSTGTEGSTSSGSSEADLAVSAGLRKVPRVVLRLGPDPSLSAGS
ncbi:hypothetical protein D9615_006738 [Tricholomella constricta]|uniref:Histone deacetylase domain-containing protein n=1 Tax=Tricholomella constricta TaxID=117010 RepID=A0A8H5H757_9AGAR|nr:hypothetical protein D9615_006738 [Tricholomella constricta]